MGSFGALYYSGKLKPKAIIVGKPLVNMGTIAANMRLVRTKRILAAIVPILTSGLPTIIALGFNLPL